MCGRFGLFASRDGVEERFGLAPSALEWSPRHNIAPTQPVFAVLDGGEAAMLRWGLIPDSTPPGLRPGRTAPAHGRDWINARVETVATKASFRVAFATRRCLIAASGYYEWEGKAEPASDNEPFRLTPPSARRPHWHELEEERVFAMAGIVAEWVPEPGREAIQSCAILTTPAIPKLSAVHSRMPLLVPREWGSEWLERPPSPARLNRLADDAARLCWRSWLVSDAVNTPRNDGAALIEPR